jgi:hypothetical protein
MLALLMESVWSVQLLAAPGRGKQDETPLFAQVFAQGSGPRVEGFVGSIDQGEGVFAEEKGAKQQLLCVAGA